MKDVFLKISEVLNMIKGFDVGYTGDSLCKGKMLVGYQGRRYVLEIREIKNPSESILDDIHNVEYL